MYLQHNPNHVAHVAQEPIARLPAGSYKWDERNGAMNYFLQQL